MHEIAKKQAVFGVVGAAHDEGGKLRAKHVFGTAFCIGNDFYLTAGHCVMALEGSEVAGLGFGGFREGLISGPLGIARVKRTETVDEYDVGIIEAEQIPDVGTPPWLFGHCAPLTDVRTGGFPFALDHEAGIVTSRAFKGYIVAFVEKFRELKAGPTVYELSFPAPKGLSGAPLSIVLPNRVGVGGMFIGNRSIEMEVFREKETIAGKGEETFIKVEGLQFGIAIAAGSLRNVPSKLLGSTLGEHLQRLGLVVP
ncbi:MAG TPA: hypothetical protein VMV10_16035 [Pirellulales bacterium]|nr:hypothetical protein [Pirellulales bacterium]